MELKITVFRSTKAFLENKSCFKETMLDVPKDFSYSNLILAFKSVFGVNSKIQFFVS